jgi:hypothetical protein
MLLGMVCLKKLSVDDCKYYGIEGDGYYELCSFLVREKYKGLGTVLMDFVKKEFGDEKMLSAVDINNVASYKVLMRNGGFSVYGAKIDEDDGAKLFLLSNKTDNGTVVKLTFTQLAQPKPPVSSLLSSSSASSESLASSVSSLSLKLSKLFELEKLRKELSQRFKEKAVMKTEGSKIITFTSVKSEQLDGAYKELSSVEQYITLLVTNH